MHVWAISNQKGGVGKTTTTASLAGLLTARGLRTLVVDLDPHGSLTSYFGISPESAGAGVYELFQDVAAGKPPDPTPRLQSTSVEKLDLLPAVMTLATVERQAGTVEGFGLVIRQAVLRLADHYDYVLIDSPPMLGVLMVNALAACNRLIIPVMADFLSLRGLERMQRTLEMIGRSRKQPLPFTIVPTLYDRRPKVSADSLQALKDRYGENVWGGVIPLDTKVREASQAHLPVSLYRPACRAATAYGELLESLLRLDDSDSEETGLKKHRERQEKNGMGSKRYREQTAGALSI
ncbi:MAG: ParA family protein [Methylohalobius sp. ZOD2]|nr:ParA family protein [Methylothermaceae bacterium]